MRRSEDSRAAEHGVLGGLTLASSEGRRDHDLEAAAARADALAIVAHDLRNPLNTIQMASTILRAELDDPGQQARLDVVARAVARASRLVQDLLDVAVAESGGLSVTTRPTPVGRIMRELEEEACTQASASGKRLTVEVPSRDGEVLADPERIQQVFSNLVENSLRYAPSGGEVRVTGERAEHEWLFAVEDDGPGVREGEWVDLFAAFARGPRAARRGGAAGLGLAICKGIVDAHRGRIWTERGTRGGARFCFTLPVVAVGDCGAPDAPT